MLFYRKYEHNTSYIDRFIIRHHIKNPPLSDSYDLREVREEPEASFAQTAASPISPKRRRTISAATFQSRSLRKPRHPCGRKLQPQSQAGSHRPSSRLLHSARHALPHRVAYRPQRLRKKHFQITPT